MLKLLAHRVAIAVPLIIVATAVTFLLLQLSEVDPAEVRLGADATEQQKTDIRAELGVDRPIVVQYARWLGGAVTLDFGESWDKPVEVGELVGQRIPATLSLALGSLLVAVAIGIPLGTAAGVRAGSATDAVITTTASVGQAIPNFWAAILLAAYVAVPYGIFDAVGFVGPTDSFGGWLKTITLPSLALGTAGAAAIARQTRAAVASTVGRPFVRTATSIGYSRRSILYRDVFRNAAVPVVTVIGTQASFLLGGSFIVEKVFAIPGLGTLAFTSILAHDIPVVLAIVACSALVIMTVHLLLDLAYGLIDPRVRVS